MIFVHVQLLSFYIQCFVIVQENTYHQTCVNFLFQLEYGTSLFEDIACMIYDLYDTKRQWRTYLNALHLINIPTDFTPGPAVTIAPGKYIVFLAKNK